MPTKQPPLGSLALQAPQSPQVVHVSPSTCHDLSVFKEILREYRRLDDTITMRLNRANAAMRDSDRAESSAGNIQEQACSNIWRELVGNWKRRTELVGYCVRVVDQSLAEKRSVLEDDGEDASARRQAQGQIYAEEVKRTQIHNELRVEAIIRKRAVEAFRSRCRFFVPPVTDHEGRDIWEKAAQ
ncbi:putative caffeine-induced death protein 2 [Lyophyllum shimeji]|uniref:Caffeine-induced death protein 2 n=1 Tax=Lyophyllum shimeji TaxID=47721 RepID=A0A9P3PE62_LYOSH|nr:putative caffeine-induced death protein 2 [Lyophyllum shimeji]